jgi:hypothetical protein
MILSCEENVLVALCGVEGSLPPRYAAAGVGILRLRGFRIRREIRSAQDDNS